MEHRIQKKALKVTVATSMLIAISVILRAFGLMVPLGGAAAMRISLDGVFYKLPGILFGPLYGAIAGGLTDIIAYIVKPSGGYIPLMTFTNILGGFLPAALYLYFKKRDVKILKKIYIFIFGLAIVLGIINLIAVNFFGTSTISMMILKLGKKAQFTEAWLIILGTVGLLPFVFKTIFIKKFTNEESFYEFIKLSISIMIPALIVSTLNTYILKLFIPALSGRAFMLLFIPRIIEQLLIVPIEAYTMFVLIKTYERNFRF